MTRISINKRLFFAVAFLHFLSVRCVHADLQEKWNWNSSAVFPDHTQVMGPAIIAPLGPGGQQPAVIFCTWSTTTGYSNYGVLRAVDAATGTELWSVSSPSHHVQPSGGIAAADIDGDGYVEIVAPAAPVIGNGTLAFEHDGSFKWYSALPAATQSIRTLTIADLESDGTPEIICGTTVMDNNGNLLWTGSEQQGFLQAAAVDLDLDGFLEIIEGRTVYNYDSTILWQAPDNIFGACAAADFDLDGNPEVVFFFLGSLYLYDSGGTKLWGPVSHQGGGNGAPCIADFNGDGYPETAVSGRDHIGVYDGSGALLWQQPIVDTSSQRTGCTAFDFNGDGIFELVGQDHYYVRVYDGAIGSVLHEIENPSGTLIEYPLTADIDDDGEAEIVAVCNNYAFGSKTGVRAFEPVGETWSDCRSIWNQYGYHGTNIMDDGSIPQPEPYHWLFHNNFRAQRAIIPTPSPTETTSPTLTPSMTSTPSSTPSATASPSASPSNSPTLTPLSPSPTLTPLPSPPPIPAFGYIGKLTLIMLFLSVLICRTKRKTWI